MRLDDELTVVDAHAGGEPGRVVIGGVHDVPGETMFAKMAHLRDHGDRLRRLLLREPRGYPALCANVILPPCDPAADVGLVIMEQAEYPPMSGSNTICTVTVLLEAVILPMVEPITIVALDTPAGLVRVSAEVRDGRVRSVSFDNVPAYAAHLDVPVEVPEVGTVTVDVAWGGMFYAITDAAALGFRLTPDEGRDLVRIGEMIKAATREQWPVSHPDNPEIAGVSIMQFSGPPSSPDADLRNTVVVSSGTFDWSRPATWTGVLDRSPCGTGTCARMATLHARGRLGVDVPFVHEGILGTAWTGRILAEARVGPYAAIVPRITGSAWITARSRLRVAPDDPFPEGFTVGDLWAGPPED
ncbi:MAG TPA: proline racemase family protein [Candidatus Angelobacter sp.]|nr:proline racemase family protein [Candidatus Angelobacter sp.]